MIASLAADMKFMAIVSLIGGGLLVAAGCTRFPEGGVAALIQGAVALSLGGYTAQAAGAFRQVADGRGNDRAALMNALGALRSLYRLQVVLLGVGLGLLALSCDVVLSLGR